AASDSTALRQVGVAYGVGYREGETRDLFARRNPRQVVPLLLLRPVVEERLGGAERVRHHEGPGRGDASARDLGDHRGIRESGEAEPAILFGDDHPEEFLLLDETPCVLRKVMLLLDPPLVDHGAKLLDRPVEERSLAGAQGFALKIEELLPVRATGEKLAVPPDRSRFERDPLGVP